MMYIRVFTNVVGSYYPYVNETVNWMYDPDCKICESLETVKSNTKNVNWVDNAVLKRRYCPFPDDMIEAVGQNTKYMGFDDQDEDHTYDSYVFIVRVED